MSFGYILDQDPTERPLAVEAAGRRYYYTPRERGRHIVVAHVGDQRFIVAETVH